MVEQPRSKGCRICVQRRVKCDLTRPFCLRCQKGNRPCPGYRSGIQFYDERERLEKIFGFQRKTIADDKSAAESAKGPSRAEPNTDLDATPNRLSERNLLSGPGGHRSDEGLGIPWPRSNPGYRFQTQPRLDNNHWTVDLGISSPFIQQSQLFSLFKSAMAPPTQQNPKFYRNYGDWLNMLATMQGTDSLLDTTFRAVSLAHLSLLHRDANLMHDSRKLYVRSLNLLNKALREPNKGLSSETLSATVMLSFYEMFSSHHETSAGYDAWVKHAGGAGALMRMRGPKAHRHGVDRSMFLAYRSTLIIEAFDSRKPCFLDEPEWRQLTADLHQEVRRATPLEKGREIIDLVEAVFNELVKVPALISDAHNVVALTAAAKSGRYQIVDTISSRAKKRLSKLKLVYQRLDAGLQNNQQAVQEHASDPRDPLFPTRYIWPNIFTASHYHGCWNTLMIINMTLINFDRDRSTHQSYMNDNVDIARHICRGADYMSKSSFLGPFFVTFGLRACLFALQSGQEKQWVGLKLMEIGTKLGMAKTPPLADQALPVALKKEVDKVDQLEEMPPDPTSASSQKGSSSEANHSS